MKKFENYCKALTNLKDIFDYEEPYGNVIITGLVGLYEVCFEQSWKAMKAILEYNGVSEKKTGSPRQILKEAYQAGMIKDEAIWLAALDSRNNVAHAYNHDIAMDIVKRTKQEYYKMFCDLKEEFESNWLQ
ncbi:MAG: nucleotidyltransferase substrate binding protein [Lachnospiraceae bacterium]|nr:nucleotidyltransferase substrate binding protein [Lachnospiraceae bacterium]